MTFRTFENGIRIAEGFAVDPATGKIGELYWNTARLVLRQCVESTTPIWEDVTVKAGTTPFSTLFWDAVNDKWAENVLLLTNGRTIYAADSAAPQDLVIQSGDTTNPGVAGSDLILRPGTGALGQGVLVVDALDIIQTEDAAGPLSIAAGDSTVNAAGNDLNLSSGTGTSTQGDVNVSGEDIEINAGNKIRLNGEVVFSQILVADPASPETAQLYWHNTYQRFRKYDGTNWHWIDASRHNSPIVVIDLYDDSILTLPATTATLVDGTTVTDGMLVVMQNSGSPAVYLATVAGINITWTAQFFGQSPTTTASAGDSVFVRSGATNNDGYYFFQSTGTWFNPSASAGAVILPGIDVGNTTFWDGTSWVPDQNILQSGTGLIYAPTNNDVDAIKGKSILMFAGAKAAGTGDGGDVELSGGTSFAGIQGDVRASGNSFILPGADSALPAPAHRSGGIHYSYDLPFASGKGRISDGVSYRDFDSADINGEITGWPNLIDASFTFVDATRVFTIAQTGLPLLQFYIKGKQYNIDTTLTPQTVTIPNTVGNHYIYYDAFGVLTANTVYNLQSGLQNSVLIAIIHWNGTSSSMVADRRTLLTMDGDNRYHQRSTDPIQVKGADFAVSGISDFSSSGPAAYQFSVAAGVRYMEELQASIPAKTVAASQLPVISLNSTNQMIRSAATTAPLLNNGVANVYNLNTLGTWSQAAITVGNYVNVWLVLLNDTTFPVALLMPQAQHTSLTDAQKELPSSLVTFFPATEYKVLARLTFQSLTAMGIGARQFVSMTNFVPNHGTLADLTLNANTDRDLYHSEPASVDMYFNPVSGDVVWSGDIFIPVPGLTGATNTIAAQTINMADDQVAWITLERKISGTSVRAVTVGTPTTFFTQNNAQQDRVIIFKRIAGEVFFMRGNAEKLRKRQALADNQVAAASIFNFPNPTTPNYAYQVEYSIYRNGIMETGTIMVVRGAIGNIAQAIAGASTGSTGVVLTVAESGSTLQLQYTSTSTGQIPVIRYKISAWLAT